MSKRFAYRATMVALALASLSGPAFAQMQQDRAMAGGNANLAVTTDIVNVRKGAGMRFPVVDVLPRGAQVQIVRCNSDFCLVDQDGPSGWVAQQFLKRLILR
ncbi:hypothetical protein VW29_05995 [Devosia limi DSM 17137]|uniref:SH3 domain-containing protein n=1 Tax=Devosia limi DSM 17137 TaxID=1121477 RepID=A0A0F5LW03_9HYPH|nr:SH3 domain-containing protein [Devosia limi]KKB85837.1 hypothetical protein VW29_05995 [Devosia limi DSM 17137]SHE35044.1 SH3 domain-containing protein [Devosia limi DSM 17137]